MEENHPQRYIDIIVVGAGPAGVSTAIELSKRGKKVVIIEKDFSSSSKLSGSIMSNTLLYVSYLYHRLKTKTSSFLSIPQDINLEASFDIKKMKKYIENASAKVFKAYKEDLEKYNVEVIEASASFIDKKRILLTSPNKENSYIDFDKCVISTGSVPKSVPFAVGKKLLDPSNILNIEKIPSSITIIGGGFIGIEYATIFKRLGCAVKIIESKDRILYTFDEFIVKKYEDFLKKDGVVVIKSKTVHNIEKVGNKYLIFLDNEKIESGDVFIAVGRIPNLKSLNVENASIKMDGNFPALGENLKSLSNNNIYFAGDSAGKYMFLNWAYYSAEVIVNDIMGAPTNETSFTFPKVLYTDPEIASVGITEQEASNLKYSFNVIKYSFADLEMSIITGHSKGFIKVIYEKNSNIVLGAHMIGKGANELLPIFSLIIKLKLKIDEISKHLFSYPTFAEALIDISNKMKESNA